MRTRKKIEEELAGLSERAQSNEMLIAHLQVATVEVLLDIRDLLT
jgi:hypothetical protein